MEQRDLYDHAGKLKSLMDEMPEWCFSEENKRDLKSFHLELSLSNLSRTRIFMYMQRMRHIIRFIPKNLKTITTTDAKEMVMLLKSKGYATDSIKLYLITIRKFFSLVYPEREDIIKGIKLRSERYQYLKECLTWEDAKAMSSAASNLRDRAIPLALYESGMRMGEFLNMRKDNIVFDEFGAVINVFGKTGQRPIRLVPSSVALSNFISTELQSFPSDHYVWISIRGKEKGQPMGARAFNKVLRLLSSKAGIKKPKNPHHFRHSRASELAGRKGWNDRKMCAYFGWSPGSDMPGRYAHLSGRDIENEVLEMYGLTKSEEKKQEIRKCPRCDTINMENAKFCCKCSMVLDLDSAQRLLDMRKKENNIIESLMEDPEVRAIIIKRAKEMNITSL